MNTVELFNDTFEEKIEFMSEMYSDIARNAFNKGFILVAHKYLSYAEMYNTSQANALFKLLNSVKDISDKEWRIECSDDYQIDDCYQQERSVLKAERLRIIENTKELLELIENKNVNDDALRNLGKQDLDPENFLNLVFNNYENDLGRIEGILSKSEDLFTEEQTRSFFEQLREKQRARKRKTNEYNFKSKNLNVNNLEDAEKFIEIAQSAFLDGNLEKAERLLRKAERLHRTVRGAQLLKEVLVAKGDDTLCIEPKKEVPVKQTLNPSKMENNVQYTITDEEQMAEIRRVNQATNDYEILGVSRHCTRAEVKSAFRKLSRVLHTDKNKHLGAKEAFMAMTEAHKRLISKLKKF